MVLVVFSFACAQHQSRERRCVGTNRNTVPGFPRERNMATVITHAFVALSAGKICFERRMSARFAVVAVVCSAVPDLDVLGFSYDIAYGDLWGHRGMTHSLLFAALLSVVVVSWLFREEAPFRSGAWWRYVIFFFAVTASHGFIDAFTDGGLGIAFFSPFDTTRYFMPWRPLVVSDIGGLETLLSYDGKIVLRSEFTWVWAPVAVTLALVVGARIWRKGHRHPS